jgi:hypothetical protein
MEACPIKIDKKVLAAIGEARCRANHGVYPIGANLMSAAEVGDLVIQEYTMVRNALGAAAVAANVLDVAKTSSCKRGRANGAEDAATVPIWAEDLIANLRRFGDGLDTVHCDIMGFCEEQSFIAAREEARFQNSLIDSMSQKIHCFWRIDNAPSEDLIPTTTADLMALPREKVAKLLRFHGHRADMGLTDERLKWNLRRYLAISDEVKAEQ